MKYIIGTPIKIVFRILHVLLFLIFCVFAYSISILWNFNMKWVKNSHESDKSYPFFDSRRNIFYDHDDNYYFKNITLKDYILDRRVYYCQDREIQK